MTWRCPFIAGSAFACALLFVIPSLAGEADLKSPLDVPSHPGQDEPDEFFRDYALAARLVDQGGSSEAAIVMTLLQNKLRTTPWMEIAALKLGELSERGNPQQAMDNYQLILQRVAVAPYFQHDSPRGRFFGAALKNAAEQGVRRVRLRKLQQALDLYFSRHQHYPETLAKLAIFNFVEPEDILDLHQQPFYYLPTGRQFRPEAVYLRYELESVRPEPFMPNSPRLEATTRLGDQPLRFGAHISIPGLADPVVVEENQTIEGYFVVTVARKGMVLCSPKRVLVIPVR